MSDDDRISRCSSVVERHYDDPDEGVPPRTRTITEEAKPKEQLPLPSHPSTTQATPSKGQLAFDFNLDHGETVVQTQMDLGNRDPCLQNQELKTSFLEVFGEPGPEFHSIACVWTLSFRTFEITRIYVYKFLTLILGLPIAFIMGFLFALVSFLHIWIVKPLLRLLRIFLHQVLFVWPMLLMYVVRPCFYSMGAVFSTFRLHQTTGAQIEEPWMVIVQKP